MIGQMLSWYLVIGLVGWLTFPLTFRLLSFLPERGLAFTRPLGLLLWGYIFWLMVSFGILQNDLGGVFFAPVIVACLSLWTLRKGGWREIANWVKSHGADILSIEVLFLLAFIAWTVVRAAVPDASGTEKPMELAFINAILRSPSFPPSDPWLSGYAISYYYFGYVVVAVLARFTAVPGAVAFNLAVAAWFGMAALAAYGLLFNLLSHRARMKREMVRFLSLLAPLFLLIVSNMGGFLEVLHSSGVFWQSSENGVIESEFWTWLDIQELNQPPAPPFTGEPERPAGIWWWRSSRVLQDYTFDGQSREVIDEFPVFSFLLGDLHPHVLALPFAFLSLAIAFNRFREGTHSLHGQPGDVLSLNVWPRQPGFWLAAVVLGGMAFLNTWDLPIYLVLFSAASVLPDLLRHGWRWKLAFDFLSLNVLLGLVGGLLYLPFYLTFSSQAGGILPSLVFFTRGIHFWIMFAPLLAPAIAWLAWKWLRRGRRPRLWLGFLFAGGAIGGLWLLSYLVGFIRLSAEPSVAGIWGATDPYMLIFASTANRIANPGTWLTLFLVIGLAGSLLLHRISPAKSAGGEISVNPGSTESIKGNPVPFVLLVFLVGAALVLFPEFFYLRDLFGVRMNTIFKFYFQAWILWSIAAAYSSAVLLLELQGVKRIVFGIAWFWLIILALPYMFFGVLARTNNFQPVQWTLNGAAYLERGWPEEMEAIKWLQQAPYGVVAEAIGGSYTSFARVSTFSGLPTVLGWPGHESQWRGGANEIGSRESDIEQLYRAKDWSQASPIIDRYHIRYIYMGSLERSVYRPDEGLFQNHLVEVYRSNGVTIYEVPRYNFQQGQVFIP